MLEGTETVRVSVAFALGLIETDDPEREVPTSDEEAVTSTSPVNACRLETVIVEVPDPPGTIVNSPGFALSSKLGRVIMTVTEPYPVSDPLVPRIVTEYSPGVTERSALTASITVPGTTTLDALRLAVGGGEPKGGISESITVPEKP